MREVRGVRVFLSYRRGDVGGYAGRLSDALRERLGAKSVFQDVAAIAPGQDFMAAIDRALDESDAVLIIIGSNWLTAPTPQGAARLFETDDVVRLEVARALGRDARVVPILVGGAAMPTAAQLPDDLQGLAQRQAVVLHDESWHQDVDSLVRSLRGEPAAPAERRRRRLLIAAIAAGVLALAGVGIGLWVTSSGSGQGAGASLEISPNHGHIGTAFVVSGTGCPSDGRQINIIFDAKSLADVAWCQANHTYTASFTPSSTGVLSWADGMGKRHEMNLSPGTTYIVYAQTPTGDWVSPRVTYRVG
jgi:TIR domain